MLASVVMAVYNGGKFLRESIESILAQTYRNFEFIILNDGSTDDTRDILNEYIQRDERIQVYHGEHSGLIAALNRGCRLARGKYIVRMDADDVAFSERLRWQIEFLEMNADVALLGGAYVLINGEGGVSTTLRKPATHKQIWTMMQRGHNPFLHSTVVMRRDAFLKLEGYRSAFVHAEDYDLWRRFAERYSVANLSEPLIYYRVHAEQVTYQYLVQGVISVLASRASWNFGKEVAERRGTEMAEVTVDTLRKLGVRDLVVRQAITEALFWQATIMLLSGNESGGLRLLTDALRSSQVRCARRQSGEWLCRVHARVYRNQAGLGRRIVLELLLLLNACCTQLRLAKMLMRFDISRAFYWVSQKDARLQTRYLSLTNTR